ncbi:hypothetical protein AB0L59_26410 [Streptomyces sp. NPDC052109]|uniref:hypothetical protein n=1 Tax=Streptomyces sp. NPDC052109 TaxID=3155527 RepID=UPI00343D15E5
MAVKRTEYFNFDTGSARSLGTQRAETLMDTEDYYRPLDEARGAALHTWGVADGLGVSATPGQPGVTVQPGTALDAAGRTSVLETGGFAIVDPGVDPQQPVNIPTVVIGADGSRLDTTGMSAGTYVLTLTWREVLGETRLIRLHAPWLRLLPIAGFQDVGQQVVLAEVSLDAKGSVSGVTSGARRSVGVPVERVELRAARVTTGSPTTVGQGPAAELRGRTDGGLDLMVFAADGTGHTVLSANGSSGHLGIGTSSPSAPLHIATGKADGHGLKVTSPTGGSGIELAHDDSGPAYGMFAGNDRAWHLSNEDDHKDLVTVSPEGEMDIATLKVANDLNVGSADVRGDLKVGSSFAVMGDAGSVGIAVDGAPASALHVNGSGAHSGGDAGGYSFADRSVEEFVTHPGNGERWVWYAFEGSARLWSGIDLITIGQGDGNALDVQRRMRVRQGPDDDDGSAGIWLHQKDTDTDRAFVGMETSDSVGFWGNTGGHWGLVMDTGSGTVSCRNGLTVAGELDAGKRMRVRQGPDDDDGSAGIWLHQKDTDTDRAFVGMETSDSVGFWGNTGGHWGLVMDTGSGTVSCRNGLAVAGEAAFGQDFGRRDGPAALHLFGSVVRDIGEGILNLQSGGDVIALSGSNDRVGIGTITPAFKLDVNGDMRVLGHLEKPAGSFRIDHPLDPANKYLSHSFVESPDMANLYTGVVETDDVGEATVVLPDYFEALNRDFRYQLTPVGSLAQVAVTNEIKGNRFTVRTDQPGIKVSWQVTGVRHDAWAQSHRILVEEDKPEADRNYYLHPAEHGQPDSAGILNHREGMRDERSAEATDA